MKSTKFKIGDIVWPRKFSNYGKPVLCRIQSVSVNEPEYYVITFLKGDEVFGGVWDSDELRLLSDCPEYMKEINETI